MVDWNAVVEAGYVLPDGMSHAQAVAELSDALRSPDPRVRDEQAYAVLVRLVPALDDEQRRALGDAMARRLDDPHVQARTFAPLILDALVSTGTFDPAWLAAFAAWYPGEADLRGYDPELGWLHAVAHGADLLGAFGRCPEVAPAPLLDLAVARLLAPTEYVFAHQEDDRLAYAMAILLTRPDLSTDESVAWLGPIAADFAAAEPGPVPAYAANTIRTLRMMYFLADRGVRPPGAETDSDGFNPAVAFTHREIVKEHLAQVLAMVAPFAG